MLPLEPLTKEVDALPKKNCGVSMLTPLPLRVVTPELCILNCPLDPLIKFVEFPILKADELRFTFVPSNIIPSPPVLPTWNLGVPPLNCNWMPVAPKVGVLIENLLLVASRFISLPFELRIEPASILNPPTLPPLNNTCEPVICPLSFSFNISPTDTVPSATFNPPTLPPCNDRSDALTTPCASTEKPDDEINNSVPLAAPLIKKFVDDKAPLPILNPPISPVSAVIWPCIITLPSASKWKLLELISTKPFEPLTNWSPEPR